MDLVRNEDKKKMFELSAKVFLTKLALVPKLISLSLPLSLVWSSPGVANCTPLVGFWLRIMLLRVGLQRLFLLLFRCANMVIFCFIFLEIYIYIRI